MSRTNEEEARSTAEPSRGRGLTRCEIREGGATEDTLGEEAGRGVSPIHSGPELARPGPGGGACETDSLRDPQQV